MGFNLDQKGLQSFMDGELKGTKSSTPSGPDAQTSKKEALRLMNTFSRLG